MGQKDLGMTRDKLSVTCSFGIERNLRTFTVFDKFSKAFFVEICKVIQKLTYKCKSSRIAKRIMRRTKLKNLTLKDLKTYYNAIGIKMICY